MSIFTFFKKKFTAVNWRDICIWLTGAIILCYIAFSNRFPVVFADTGTHIESGFEGVVPADRPLSYSLFLRHASLGETLWLVVFVQSLILSWLLFLSFKSFIPGHKSRYFFIVSVILVSFFSGASAYICHLVPDAFTAILLLSFVLTLSLERPEKGHYALLIFFVWLAAIMHNSHIMILAGMMVIITIIHLIKKSLKKPLRLVTRRIAQLWMITVFSYLSVCSIHWMYGGGFTFSKNSHVFLMYRVNEYGLLDHFLKYNCDNNDYDICAYKDDIPIDFIWDKKSPVHLAGGWEKTEEEYNRIFRDMFSQPRYVKLYIQKSIEATFKQFFNYNIEISKSANRKSNNYHFITEYLPFQKLEFQLSEQFLNNMRAKRDYLNFWQNLMIPFAAMVMLCFVFSNTLKKSVRPDLVTFGILIFLGLLANAAVCGTFTLTAERYQARIVWLIIICAVIFMAQRSVVTLIFEKISSYLKNSDD